MKRSRLWPAVWALPLWMAAAGWSALLSDCSGGGGDVAVPRREAFPRIQLYDTAYRAVEGLPLTLSVNVSALTSVAERDGGLWVDIVYPRYHATVYVTLTRVDAVTLPAVMENRLRRMELNRGGEPAEDVEEVESPAGFLASIVAGDAAGLIPMQFISTDHERWVVSGAVVMAGATRTAARDSVRPVVDALRADLRRAMADLK